MRGKFITFEGVEGCGKTTQIRRVRDYLVEEGFDVDITREPGGTPIAERIREILLDIENIGMTPITELLLYEAARAQHVHERIRPCLRAGRVVLSDRFADSTSAYQGAGRGLDMASVTQLHTIATGGLRPDLTIVLDLPAREGLERAGKAREADRIEQESLEFHSRVRYEFLKLAENEPDRMKVIDAQRDIETVSADVLRLVRERLGLA